nr:hypothetical protein [Micromonospora sp. DSM 115978]
MPLVAAAVCPHPPMILPEVAGAAATELDDLRAACDAAVAVLAASGAATLVLLGTGTTDRWFTPPLRGSFRAWGVPVEVSVGGPAPVPPAALPLSLLVGSWLVQRAFRPTRPVQVRMAALRADGPPGAAVDMPDDEPWALLAMGDGSACRGVQAPGYDDPRARPYDDRVASALAGADADALLDLDPRLSTELGAAGRAPWQALATAARRTGCRWRAELSYYAAPYGVAYFVATWTPDPADRVGREAR